MLLNDEYKDYVERADFTVRNEGVSEFVSLFGNIIQDEITIKQERKLPIKYDDVKHKMGDIYEKRKSEF